MAAYHCLQRFRAHLFRYSWQLLHRILYIKCIWLWTNFFLGSREKEIQLWEHFVNALQKGISANLSDDQDDTAPRLSCIVTTFLAQMSLVIGEPLHPLYVLLTNFLLAKPIFDINTVPNFLMLFYSTDERNKYVFLFTLGVPAIPVRFIGKIYFQGSPRMDSECHQVRHALQIWLDGISEMFLVQITPSVQLLLYIERKYECKYHHSRSETNRVTVFIDFSSHRLLHLIYS